MGLVLLSPHVVIYSPSEQKTRSRGLCTVTTWKPALHWQIALWRICTQSECGSLEMHVRSWKHCSPSLTAANKPKSPSRSQHSSLGSLAYIQLAKIAPSQCGVPQSTGCNLSHRTNNTWPNPRMIALTQIHRHTQPAKSIKASYLFQPKYATCVTSMLHRWHNFVFLSLPQT
jgi:hypothetical protein